MPFIDRRSCDEMVYQKSHQSSIHSPLAQVAQGLNLQGQPRFHLASKVRITASHCITIDFPGPTSLSFLLHTSLPVGAADAYDLREHSKWEILDDGNGLIRVTAPPDTSGYADADRDDPTKAHNRLTRPVLSAQTISLLVNEYFDHVAPLFPIISKSDFASKLKPGPLLLYAICGLGATRRKFPREVFAGVRGVINGLLRSNDILSDARMENVQALVSLWRMDAARS